MVSICSIGQKTFTEAPVWEKGSQIMAYYGDQISNPGLYYAYEYAFVNNVKTKIRIKRGKNRTKYKTHRLELVPNVTTYWDPQAHVGFIPNLSVQYKKINHHRWMMNMGIGMGAFMNYLPEVFTVSDGQVSDAQGQLQTYLAPSFNLAFGRMKQNDGKIQGLSFGIRNHFLLNYNNTIQLAPAIAISYNF
jgi:hypothetical protein